MSRDYPHHPRLAVLAALRRDDRLLLVQRTKEPQGSRLWGLPGGAVELGETLFQAAARELREETGIVARPHRVLDVFDRIEPDQHGRVRSHFVLVTVVLDWQAGEAAAASDAAALGWFDRAAIAALPCHPHLPRLADMLLA